MTWGKMWLVTTTKFMDWDGNTWRVWGHTRATLGRSRDTSRCALCAPVCGFLFFWPKNTKVIQKSREPGQTEGSHLDETSPGGVPEGLPMEMGDFALSGKIRNYRARGSTPKTRYCGHLNSRLMRFRSKALEPNWLSYYMGER